MKRLTVFCLVIVFGLVCTLDAYPDGLNLNYEYEREPDLSLVTGNSSPFDHYGDYSGLSSKGYLSTQGNMSNRMQSREKPLLSTEKVAGQFLLGMLGNVVMGIFGAYIALRLDIGRGDDGFGRLYLGYCTGAALGSALGVYLAGSSRDVRGSFGKALLGSTLGLGMAFATRYLTQWGSDFSISLITFPPIGAAILFNRSLRYRSSSQTGTALLNFNKGKIKIGVPYVNIQPLPRYSSDIKRPVRVNISLLNAAF